MLNENIQALRKSKGLSQEELALKLNVVRQTVSKWERGLSVPDAEMLVVLGETLDVPVSKRRGARRWGSPKNSSPRSSMYRVRRSATGSGTRRIRTSRVCSC